MTEIRKSILTRQLAPKIAGTLVALTLIGCGLPQKSYPPMNNYHPIQIAESVERLELYARPDGLSLSARDQDAVMEFINQYATHGDGPLYVNLPNRPDYQAGIHQTKSMITQNLAHFGKSAAAIQSGQYQAAQGPAPVIVSYRRLKTLPKDCRELGNLTMVYNNQPYDGYGCAYHANLAAMISDPRQLLEPRPMAPTEVRRRVTVYDKYLAGESPASELPGRQQVSSGG